MNQELQKYIQDALKAGSRPEDIRKALVGSGWSMNEVWAVFQSLQNTPKSKNGVKLIMATGLITVAVAVIGVGAYFTLSKNNRATSQSPSVTHTPTPPPSLLPNDTTASPVPRGVTSPVVESFGKLKIISPLNGSIVEAGAVITFTVEIPNGVVPKEGVVLLPSGTLEVKQDQIAPYSFEVAIPSGHDLGPIKFTAFAKEVGEDQITLDVESSKQIVNLRVEPSEIHIKNVYSSGDPLSQDTFNVIGAFSDNSWYYLEASSKILYSVDDANVAEVVLDRPSGELMPLVRGKRAGKANVIVSYGGKSVKLPVSIESSNRQPVIVIVPEPKGSFSELPAVRVGETVILDASKSYDPDGDPLTFFWEFRNKPKGSNAVIIDADEPVAKFVPDKPGSYGSFYNLTVQDNHGGSATQAWAVDVAGPVSITKSTVVTSSSRVRADGTLVRITATVLNDNGTPVKGDPLILFARYPWMTVPAYEGNFQPFITDEGGRVVFEVSSKSPGSVIYFVRDGGFRGLKLEQEITIEYY